MGPVHREVLRDEVAVADEVVLLDGDWPEVVVDDAQDALQTGAALGTGCVVHQVRGDKIVEDGAITRLQASEHLLEDLVGRALTHGISASIVVVPVWRWTECLGCGDPAPSAHGGGVADGSPYLGSITPVDLHMDCVDPRNSSALRRVAAQPAVAAEPAQWRPGLPVTSRQVACSRRDDAYQSPANVCCATVISDRHSGDRRVTGSGVHGHDKSVQKAPIRTPPAPTLAVTCGNAGGPP